MRPDLHDAPRPIDVELLTAYVATEVLDDDGAVWSGPDAAPVDGEVWVVTAENPFSELQDVAVNAAAMAELARTIRAAGHDPVVMVGRAPDLSWSEECFGVRGDVGDLVRAWGRERGQHAVFRLTADAHDVVSCWSGEVLATRPRVG
jgi:hypothetical protein